MLRAYRLLLLTALLAALGWLLGNRGRWWPPLRRGLERIGEVTLAELAGALLPLLLAALAVLALAWIVWRLPVPRPLLRRRRRRR